MNRSGGALMRARELRKEYGRGEGLVRAVDNIGLEMASTPSRRSQLRDGTGQGRLQRPRFAPRRRGPAVFGVTQLTGRAPANLSQLGKGRAANLRRTGKDAFLAYQGGYL